MAAAPQQKGGRRQNTLLTLREEHPSSLPLGVFVPPAPHSPGLIYLVVSGGRGEGQGGPGTV